MHTSRFILLLGGILFFIISASLLRSILLSRQAHRSLEEQRKQVELLQKEIDTLEIQVQEATSSFELERRVRESLNQQKSGERILELQGN